VEEKKAETERLEREVRTMEESRHHLEREVTELKKGLGDAETREREALEEAARASDDHRLHIRQKQERERKLKGAEQNVVRLTEQAKRLEEEVRKAA
jgi:cell division protein FtsB